MMRVLFVDDEQPVLDGLCNLLRRNRRKWEMVFALGAEAALEALHKAPFDVVVSDMRMPGMDGAALLAEVQREFPGTARIILSGYAGQEASTRAATVAHRFLSKPSDGDTIERAIETSTRLQGLIASAEVRGVVGGIDALPSQPQAFTRLVEKLHDETADPEEIARVLEADVAMCAKMLQLANSAFFGLPRRVTRLADAVQYLGHSVIQTLALTASVFNSVSGLPDGQLEALQSHALRTAHLAREMALTDGSRDADDALIAGMLHDIGLLVLASRMPEQYEALVANLAQQPRPVHEAELELWGVGHAEIGALLLSLWGLPTPVIEAVAQHHQPWDASRNEFDLGAVTRLAEQLVQESEAVPCGVAGALASVPDERILDLPGARVSLAKWRERARSMELEARRAA